ncbi:unnamed protein product [Phytophthora fragariaefolia]|uniref:Unnamed protein product n=1 Tax=Phytophthora fragariaefolia TaxID=1490495 RepID=A0A9W7D2S9_9STRA|nr:unnamed protein product [Phytophthora fragariaefolia]
MEQPPANEGVPPPAPAQAADSGSSGAAVSLDSEWSDTDESPVASIVDDDDYETHESCEEVEECDEDLSAFLVDGSVAEQASRLVRDDPCEQKCLKGKEAELGNFLQSVSGMERSERITSVMTALAVLMEADTASFHRGNGLRNKFRYFLPLVSNVCALSFCASYGCTLGTIQRYKAQIRRGEFAAIVMGTRKTKMHLSSMRAGSLNGSLSLPRRLEYKADLKAASDTHAILVMDFSQNLSCPSISDTPSMWYFLSLLSISVFGIYYANDAKQYNYIYDERVSGKGTDQVNSMMYDFLTKNVIARQIRRLTVYADNCGGQNKSNHVIHFLLALVHQGLLDSVDFNFSCAGTRRMRATVALDRFETALLVLTAGQLMVLSRTELYKPLSAVQKYHIFSANKDSPGVITCKSSPNDDGISEDLRRKIDKVKTPSSTVSLMFERYLLPLTPPQPNAEKIDQMHRKVRPFVPLEFQDDPLYAAPTADEAAQSKNNKRARLKRRADMALEAKRVQDEQQNSPSFVEQLEQAMNDIEDASALPKAKQPKRSTTKKKARKESFT